ncbi:MAG: hypothetical protein Q8Q92_03455 [bacterium]|nr:hypothetical protein [bacterium]
MISLKKILLELLPQQPPVPGQPPVPPAAPQPGTVQNQSLELPKYNLIVSIMEKEKKINFSPLNSSMPAPQARTLINELKSKFKISLVQQQPGGIFIVTLDPRTEVGLVIDYLQQHATV